MKDRILQNFSQFLKNVQFFFFFPFLTDSEPRVMGVPGWELPAALSRNVLIESNWDCSAEKVVQNLPWTQYMPYSQWQKKTEPRKVPQSEPIRCPPGTSRFVLVCPHRCYRLPAHHYQKLFIRRSQRRGVSASSSKIICNRIPENDQQIFSNFSEI